MISPGDIVCSIAGRDSGCYFAVMTVDGIYAYICDGKKRKTDKPKRKKVKHLKVGCGCSEYIAEKLAKGEQVTNAELRREIRPYAEPHNG